MKARLTSVRNQPCVIVMVKEPRPGQVKTRLGRDIGMLDAAHWYRRHVAKLVHRLVDERWTLVAGFAPKTARIVPRNTQLDAWQGTGDLGRRMIRLLRQAPPKSVLIGSDIAGLERCHIARAIAALGTHDTVLGPSPDGGFWLIGARHPRRLRRDVLDGARWSTEHALADTQARLPGRVALVDTLNDVDTIDDLP
ncbi:TIGR04282 family arsenosugar biosynthesis glycosyltransferase [uncultured Tateyamaria sp.]|uniref:TIGR04282 family arsenosugar biosynthesis glycosyltransferase n=1 Tax=Tateyamaria sp. 1078 TaxID=3417464 RepID=UPI002629B8B0|nr:TIGR04282 family arsenosugar biosynthesis glycosyltransferase [uncultured Tateyamaria sp.]